MVGPICCYADKDATTSITEIEPPTKFGYKFLGYYNNNEMQLIDEDGLIINSYPQAWNELISYTTPIKAKWEERTITGISVSATPTKTTYTEGENLDLTGGKITVTYDDEETEEVPMTSEGVSVTGYDKDTTGTQEITVTYKEKTAKFNVTVKEKNIGFEVEATKDNTGNKIVKVTITDTEREVSKVIVDNEEIEKNEDGEYIFTPTKNGDYTIKATYADGTIETYVYTEGRLTDSETPGDNEEPGDNETPGDNEEPGDNKTPGKSEESGKSEGQVYSGKQTDTTTAGKVIPKTGLRVSIIIAAISIGACAVFFKIKSERIDK